MPCQGSYDGLGGRGSRANPSDENRRNTRLVTTNGAMKRKTTKSVWPILLLVVILFVLSVLAPGEWRSVAISPDGGTNLDRNANTHQQHPAAANPSIQDDRDDPIPSLLPEGIELLSPVEVRTLMAEQAEVSGPAAEPETASAALDRFAMPQRVVEIGPPVARQFVAETLAGRTTPPVVEVEPEIERRLPANAARLARRDLSPRSENSARKVVRRSSESTPGVVTHWAYASELASRVEALSARDDCAAWCKEVDGHLRHLASFESLESDEIAPLLGDLRDLAARGLERANGSDDVDLRSDLGRTAHAIKRRLVIWEQLCAIVSGQNPTVSTTVTDSDHYREVIESLESKLGQMQYGRKWREYLLLDEAKRQLCGIGARDTAECRELAKRVLLRMEYAVLTPAQHGFLEQPEICEYAAELRGLAVEPVDYLLLMDALERYEKEGNSEHAVHVAAAQQMLRWADSAAIAELGFLLNAHYRNANLRIAISEDLFNRFIPTTTSRKQEVNEVILGAPVSGQSETLMRLRLDMLPSTRSWRFALEALGEINSHTYSSRGPATFYAEAESEFRAEKRVVVHLHRIAEQPAYAVAENSPSLTSIDTRLDPLPIVGEATKAIARRRYYSKLPAARAEAESKIAWRAGTALDTEVAGQLAEARQRLANHFRHPMQTLALNPIAMEMRTTENEAIARVRLAAYDQLAAHSPRPTSPEGSWLSVQIHESALNNCIEQLGWQGQRVNLRDLYREVGDLFNLPDIEIPEDLPDNVTVRFARQDPLRMSFHDGRASLTLALAELSEGRKRWRNFIVRVHYRPATEQPDADLVRDKYLELIGRLGLRDQIALRGIFSRVFSRTEPISFISTRLRDDPRLEGLALTQFAIGDGWIGIAVGPRPSVSLSTTGEHRTGG